MFDSITPKTVYIIYYINQFDWIWQNAINRRAIDLCVILASLRSVLGKSSSRLSRYSTMSGVKPRRVSHVQVSHFMQSLILILLCTSESQVLVRSEVLLPPTEVDILTIRAVSAEETAIDPPKFRYAREGSATRRVQVAGIKASFYCRNKSQHVDDVMQPSRLFSVKTSSCIS